MTIKASSSESIYVIPPYLLDTYEGSQLQRTLFENNPQLSENNVITNDSPYFYKPQPKSNDNNTTNTKDKYSFSDNPILNQLIKEKILYKLSILGILGVNPMEFNKFDDKYIFETFEIFKSRLLEETRPDSESESSRSTTAPLTRDSLLDTITPQTIFASEEVGEIGFKNLYKYNDETRTKYEKDPTYKNFCNSSLKELLKYNDVYYKYKLNYQPSYVTFGKDNDFQYHLPLNWTPLIPSKYLKYIKDNWNLEIDNSSGYSTIELKAGSSFFENSNSSIDEFKNRYYNFITDNSIKSSAGIFYYEIEVEQKLTQSTNYKSIICMNDLSISSNSTLELLAGFTKRFITYDSVKISNSAITHSSFIDLEKIKNDIQHDESTEGFSSSDLKVLLNTKPGEFKGSFAVNFADSSFYNSIKGSESQARTQILNMNRRLSTAIRNNQADLDSGKLDLGVPFKTKLLEDKSMKRIYKTDVIGCGINFVNKTMFITLNGVLTKIINEKEMASAHSSSNDLFENSSKDLVKGVELYPMLGFKLNDKDLSYDLKEEPSTCKITTNLGFKEFKYNINNYVDNFKNENHKTTYLSLLERIKSQGSNINNANDESIKIENSLLNPNENPILMNKLIKGYLVQRGYINAFKAFNSDLKDLQVVSDPTTTEDTNQEINEAILEKSNAKERQHIKKLMQENKFDRIIPYIESKYTSSIFKNQDIGKDAKFEIKKLNFMFMLKNYLNRKLQLHDNFEFEFTDNEQDILKKAISQRNQLLKEFSNNSTRQDEINELSSLLLIQSKQDLNNLPKAKLLLKNFDLQYNKTFELINSAILSLNGFGSKSNLQKIFEKVDQNLSKLVKSDNSDDFVLMNVEKDYME
ncbi:hypothetical protein KGF54_001060 [Candida jiufengensis]|uniref:uncharacterized protein n=1 Tax=Candida jiufengensis TaxID=497108 RepID=UPI0022246D99|nr:uncharacterized protein KGF54_001060 [Candida jiufengensis]KAI5956585.1 hypothetical protein KGF54_001060 [Candida jiufengensis]